MARPQWPDMSPWRRRTLTIPPDCWQGWVRLAVWELWTGALLCGAAFFGVRLIVTAPDSIVTVFDLSRCYAVPPATLPCERIAYRAGELNAALNVWCGVLLMTVAGWLLCELWSAAAPKPVTDDFLKLLEDSFARDWRRPKTWPWARLAWAYGFTVAGAALAVSAALVASAVIASTARTNAPAAHVETSQSFRAAP